MCTMLMVEVPYFYNRTEAFIRAHAISYGCSSSKGVPVPSQRSEKKINKKLRLCFFLVGNISGIYDRNSTDWIKKVLPFS